MKLSELEKLANETGYMGRADPEDILILCATFMEMLEALHFFAQHLHPTPDSKIAATIKKAEEML